jgi:N-acetylglucosaminyldiphosphoundecaprenol N-acetyl-beta-D-mannosaminyltransferase
MFVVSNEEIKNKFIALKPGASFLIPEFFTMGEPDKLDCIGTEMTNEIIRKNINYVFIGISEPKQGALGQNVSEKLKELGYPKSCVFFFLGASFEFFFGLKKRAPTFFRKFGLEWFYRLLSEPKRMFKRYVVGNFIFVLRSIHWIINKSAYN